ncbi:MAG TPA: heme exporter protein CcmB [Bacteroidia bacterium]|jgi:heme exporter protein B|nr:heme exporter protein CcmB [Bacteroidia bacterium]
MSVSSQTFSLLKREFLQEQRQKYAFFGVLLFLVSTIFIAKFSFHTIKSIPVWNSLYWVILLFAAVTGAAKSFGAESKGRLLYLYTIADPKAVLLSKMLYNVLLMLVLGFTGMIFYSFLIGFPVQDTPMFLVALFLGSTGLACAFTMISAIASKAGNNFTLMAILGFPVVLPLLLAAIKVSKYAADGLGWAVSMDYMLVLGMMNLVIIALAYLLFPYLWRD